MKPRLHHRLQRGLCSLTLAAACAAPLTAAEPLADPDIRDAVQDALMSSPRVFSGSVDITVDHGRVVLDGLVDNLLAKRRASRLASLTRGVMTVDNNLQVHRRSVDDGELAQDIELALVEDPAAESYEITVSVSDGVATLDGTVDSWQEREMAAYAAMGVRGVYDVVNDIEVGYDASRSDQDIRGDVNTAIAMDPYLESYLLTVSVDDANVSVSGTVGSLYEKQVLRGHCWTAGVDAVDLSAITIMSAIDDDHLRGPISQQTRDDAAIASAISYHINHDPLLADDGLTVRVNDGTARLYGTVETLRDQSAAARTARRVAGVLRVKNYVTVVPSHPTSDRALEAAVSRSISRDPWLERSRVEISADNGTVSLSGQVNDAWERQHCEEVVERIDGVTQVHNWLLTNNNDSGSAFFDYDYGFSYGFDYHAPLYGDAEADTSDWAIRQEIRDELFWSPLVDSDDITVTVDDGEATLSGQVADWKEYWAARANAFEGGAVVVDSSSLTIESMID